MAKSEAPSGKPTKKEKGSLLGSLFEKTVDKKEKEDLTEEDRGKLKDLIAEREEAKESKKEETHDTLDKIKELMEKSKEQDKPEDSAAETTTGTPASAAKPSAVEISATFSPMDKQAGDAIDQATATVSKMAGPLLQQQQGPLAGFLASVVAPILSNSESLSRFIWSKLADTNLPLIGGMLKKSAEKHMLAFSLTDQIRAAIIKHSQQPGESAEAIPLQFKKVNLADLPNLVAKVGDAKGNVDPKKVDELAKNFVDVMVKAKKDSGIKAETIVATSTDLLKFESAAQPTGLAKAAPAEQKDKNPQKDDMQDALAELSDTESKEKEDETKAEEPLLAGLLGDEEPSAKDEEEEEKEEPAKPTSEESLTA